MAVYTVHEPRMGKDGSVATPERYRFVRDGFYFWALLLGPLWMLWHGLWLVLLGYLVVTAGVQVGLFMLGVSAVVRLAVGLLIALLVGVEAGTLRRWSLRRWTNVGVVVASSREEAERRFFDSWNEPQSVPPLPPDMSIPPGPTEVIGLFPEPQPRP